MNDSEKKYWKHQCDVLTQELEEAKIDRDSYGVQMGGWQLRAEKAEAELEEAKLNANTYIADIGFRMKEAEAENKKYRDALENVKQVSGRAMDDGDNNSAVQKCYIASTEALSGEQEADDDTKSE